MSASLASFFLLVLYGRRVRNTYCNPLHFVLSLVQLLLAVAVSLSGIVGIVQSRRGWFKRRLGIAGLGTRGVICGRIKAEERLVEADGGR
jgi:hypothetical protein